MQVLCWVGVEYELFEVCDTPRYDDVGHHYEAGLIGILILLYESLTLIPA